MSWFERLAALYDIQEHSVPLYHESRVISTVADITPSGEVTGFRKADFTAAVPVTERSAVRTSAAAPHPLFDSADYLTASNNKYHDAYLEQLSRWADSPFSCAELKAVYSSVSRGLIAGSFPERGLIAFSVGGIPLWDNERLQALWISFCRAMTDSVGICAGTGLTEPLSFLHPKGLLPERPAAKLISANQSGRLLFSDRLSGIGEAIPLGAESSMKAHRALKRLLEEYGYRIDDCVFAGFTDRGGFSLAPLFIGGDLRPLLESLSCERAVILAVSAHSEGRISFSMYRELTCAELANAVKRCVSPIAGMPGVNARECLRKLDVLLRGKH